MPIGRRNRIPAYKHKYFTLTLADVGATSSVAHGLDLSKIVSVSVLVSNTDGYFVPPSFLLYGSTTDSYFTYLVEDTLFKVLTGSTATSIAGKTARIFITYIP